MQSNTLSGSAVGNAEGYVHSGEEFGSILQSLTRTFLLPSNPPPRCLPKANESSRLHRTLYTNAYSGFI